MKRYSKKDLLSMPDVEFAMDVLQTELNHRDPYTPVADKLRSALKTLNAYKDIDLQWRWCDDLNTPVDVRIMRGYRIQYTPLCAYQVISPEGRPLKDGMTFSEAINYVREELQ